ncbi:YigZ family protein [Clostridium fungisolvens]|uniref:IMPACT family member YigZ n=1 Tax=Clostridium fungisolvens TaxID=1604897 RepID=A0A6V8SJZ3_9CLOT|nr:YigZ family protein [Clostridium fungisolvens]GFP76865.1 IMPACT family member YigZ [Clostridium fungisolvens]
MAYLTIKGYGEDSFDEKKSEFIGYIKRTESEEEAKAFVTEIKNKHKDATHNCYAYIVGQNMNIQRYSDDGEPQGTAGIPILEVIKKNEITDCTVVVTRYFGGILLGAGGLTRAYTKGAAVAIKAAGIVDKVLGVRINVTLEYDLLGKIQYICGQNQWHIENIDYTDVVDLYILAEKQESEIIKQSLTEQTNGKVIIFEDEEGLYFRQDNRLFKEI